MMQPSLKSFLDVLFAVTVFAANMCQAYRDQLGAVLNRGLATYR